MHLQITMGFAVRRASWSAAKALRPMAMRATHGFAAPILVEQTVLSTLQKKCGVDDQTGLLLAVSGGSDSVAMLHILAKLKQECLPRLQLNVVHFNHRLRPESEEEAQFVSDLAKQYNLPLFYREWKAGTTISSESHFEDLQNRARQWRRSECAAIINSTDFCVSATQVLTATAHQLDDQVETVLMKILRGVHLSNIKGMEYRAEHHIRPMLDIRKADLVNYLRMAGFSWREDSSNASPKYKRNRVRNELIPLIEELSGGQSALWRRLSEISEQSSQLASWMQSSTIEVQQSHKPPYTFELSQNFRALPEMVRSSILHDWIVKVSAEPMSFDQTARVVELAQKSLLAGTAAKQITLSNYWLLTRKADTLVLQKHPMRILEIETKFSGVGENITVLHAEHVRVKAQRIENGATPGNGLVLYNVPPNPLLRIRKRKDGDRFHPSTKANPGKLSDFLRQLDVPLHVRDEFSLVCLVADDRGTEQIIAVYPDCPSQYHETNTTNFAPLHVQLEDDIL